MFFFILFWRQNLEALEEVTSWPAWHSRQSWPNVREHQLDEVAEWLRRWTANPMGSARVGSNPILVVGLFSKSGHSPAGA